MYHHILLNKTDRKSTEEPNIGLQTDTTTPLQLSKFKSHSDVKLFDTRVSVNIGTVETTFSTIFKFVLITPHEHIQSNLWQ